MLIAIQPDDYGDPRCPDRPDASSPRWAKALAEAGHTVRWVDVHDPDILKRLADCEGFMWRWAHFGGMYRIARRLLPVVERSLGLTVYPDQATCWHYDDKAAQAMLLDASGCPVPQTAVFFDAETALASLRAARYPIVAKLATGAGSTNVRLISDHAGAVRLIRAVFSRWCVSLPEEGALWRFGSRLREATEVLLTGRCSLDWSDREPQKSCVCFQEFLPQNEFDTRVTVIGRRAFAFRRWNRAGDFRASGSGHIDFDPDKIDQRFVQLAFDTAEKLRLQSCAIDGLYDCHGSPVLVEISYTYASWAVHACPGHWERDPNARGEVRWMSGQMWPEEAQVSDFLIRLQQRCDSRTSE